MCSLWPRLPCDMKAIHSGTLTGFGLSCLVARKIYGQYQESHAVKTAVVKLELF